MTYYVVFRCLKCGMKTPHAIPGTVMDECPRCGAAPSDAELVDVTGE